MVKMELGIWTICMLFVFVGFASAAIDAGYCVDAQVTSINPSSINSDEEFTVGIVLENCGEEIPEDVSIEIIRHSPDIQIKESLILDIGRLTYSNSERNIVYHMYSSQDAFPGVHTFEAKLKYGTGSYYAEKYFNFSITVLSKASDLAISRVSFEPKRIHPFEEFVLTIDVENAGKGEAKNIKVLLEGAEDFVGVRQDYLGKLEQDDNLPARFYLISSEEAGLKEANIRVEYEESGELKVMDFPVQIQIFEKSKTVYYVVSGLFLLILILGISFYLFNKGKDKYDVPKKK